MEKKSASAALTVLAISVSKNSGTHRAGTKRRRPRRACSCRRCRGCRCRRHGLGPSEWREGRQTAVGSPLSGTRQSMLCCMYVRACVQRGERSSVIKSSAAHAHPRDRDGADSRCAQQEQHDEAVQNNGDANLSAQAFETAQAQEGERAMIGQQWSSHCVGVRRPISVESRSKTLLRLGGEDSRKTPLAMKATTHTASANPVMKLGPTCHDF